MHPELLSAGTHKRISCDVETDKIADVLVPSCADTAGSPGYNAENETQGSLEHGLEEEGRSLEIGNGDERGTDDNTEMDDMGQQDEAISSPVSREDADLADANEGPASSALPSAPSDTTSPKRPLQEAGSEPEAKQPRLE
jgi:hypothetical protein